MLVLRVLLEYIIFIIIMQIELVRTDCYGYAPRGSSQKDTVITNQYLGRLFVTSSQGVLTHYYTLEPKDLAIPCGVYPLKYTYSPRFERKTFEVFVPGRNGIRVHSGNSVNDSRGCILLGCNYKVYSTRRVLLENSLSAVSAFERTLSEFPASEEFVLSVIESF